MCICTLDHESGKELFTSVSHVRTWTEEVRAIEMHFASLLQLHSDLHNTVIVLSNLGFEAFHMTDLIVGLPGAAQIYSETAGKPGVQLRPGDPKDIREFTEMWRTRV